MTSFSETWNAGFLAQPADTEAESLGASRIRETKQAVGQRLAVDHSLAGDGFDGQHNQATLRPAGSPAAIALDAGNGRLFSAAFGGRTELYYQDSSNTISRITTAGSVGGVPPGCQMLFANNIVPTGWTLNPALNDALVRIVNDPGQAIGVGGGWAITGLTTNDHTLTTSEIPSHQHTFTLEEFDNVPLAFRAQIFAGGNFTGNSASYITDGAGGGGAHNHGGIISDAAWRPVYCNFIMCIKD